MRSFDAIPRLQQRVSLWSHVEHHLKRETLGSVDLPDAIVYHAKLSEGAIRLQPGFQDGIAFLELCSDRPSYPPPALASSSSATTTTTNRVDDLVERIIHAVQCISSYEDLLQASAKQERIRQSFLPTDAVHPGLPPTATATSDEDCFKLDRLSIAVNPAAELYDFLVQTFGPADPSLVSIYFEFCLKMTRIIEHATCCNHPPAGRSESSSDSDHSRAARRQTSASGRETGDCRSERTKKAQKRAQKLQNVSHPAVDLSTLFVLAKALAFESADRSPAKVGLMLLSVMPPGRLDDSSASASNVLEKIFFMGACEEFTFFSIRAIFQSMEYPEEALLSLGHVVHGWGRIMVVNLLGQMDSLSNEATQWLLLEGSVNGVSLYHTACAVFLSVDLVHELEEIRSSPKISSQQARESLTSVARLIVAMSQPTTERPDFSFGFDELLQSGDGHEQYIVNVMAEFLNACGSRGEGNAAAAAAAAAAALQDGGDDDNDPTTVSPANCDADDLMAKEVQGQNVGWISLAVRLARKYCEEHVEDMVSDGAEDSADDDSSSPSSDDHQ